MAKLSAILAANTQIATAIETKFAFLPKLSTQLASVASQVPVGPELPAFAVTVLEPPPPNRAGQPLASFFNSTPITGPTVTGLAAPKRQMIPPLDTGGVRQVIPGQTALAETRVSGVAKQVANVFTNSGY